jgi:hypothetical protein
MPVRSGINLATRQLGEKMEAKVENRRALVEMEKVTIARLAWNAHVQFQKAQNRPAVTWEETDQGILIAMVGFVYYMIQGDAGCQYSKMWNELAKPTLCNKKAFYTEEDFVVWVGFVRSMVHVLTLPMIGDLYAV